MDELKRSLERTTITLAIMRKRREQGAPVVITCGEYRDLKTVGVALAILTARNIILTIGSPTIRYRYSDGGWRAD